MSRRTVLEPYWCVVLCERAVASRCFCERAVLRAASVKFKFKICLLNCELHRMHKLLTLHLFPLALLDLSHRQSAFINKEDLAQFLRRNRVPVENDASQDFVDLLNLGIERKVFDASKVS